MVAWMTFALLCYVLWVKSLLTATVAIAFASAPALLWGLFLVGVFALNILAAIVDK